MVEALLLFLGLVAAILLAAGGLIAIGIPVVTAWILGLFSRPLLKSPLQIFPNLFANAPNFLFSLSEQAQTGEPATRVLSGHPPADWQNLRFSSVQSQSRRLSHPGQVDLAVRIGPAAARPLRLALPVLLGGMGYGVALSEGAAMALALASTLTGTVYNTGEGPLLPRVRQIADRVVAQVGRGAWSHRPEALRQADMIEIQAAQGAEGPLGLEKKTTGWPPEVLRHFGIAKGETLLLPGRLNWQGVPACLGDLVTIVRREAPGRPVGVKLAVSGTLLRDVAEAMDAGVDFLTLDGAGAGSHAAPAVISDHFGFPVRWGLQETDRFLRQKGQRQQVSLIASGGFREGGEILKALALGADAVAIGTVAIMAMSHNQLHKVLPAGSPIDLVRFRPGKKSPLDVEQAARSLANHLLALEQEMRLGLLAMGRRNLRDLGPWDLWELNPGKDPRPLAPVPPSLLPASVDLSRHRLLLRDIRRKSGRLLQQL